jgi:hypothetical protein
MIDLKVMHEGQGYPFLDLTPVNFSVVIAERAVVAVIKGKPEVQILGKTADGKWVAVQIEGNDLVVVQGIASGLDRKMAMDAMDKAMLLKALPPK